LRQCRNRSFEAALADQERPTASGIIKANLPSKAKPVSDGALWLWGRLRDFERQGFFDQRPGEILSTMTAEMLAGTRSLAPRVAAWLNLIGSDPNALTKMPLQRSSPVLSTCVMTMAPYQLAAHVAVR
jgi:hypothetical protein